jgi:xylulokinase
MDMPRPGFFEHDAERVWWHDFVAIVRSLLQQTGLDSHRIRGIGASAIGSCVLPIDEAGNPLRPAILYGIDTRATAEIAFLESRLGKDKIFGRSAMHLSSQASGPRCCGSASTSESLRGRWFLTSQAYLVYKLTGQASIDVYTAGGTSHSTKQSRAGGMGSCRADRPARTPAQDVLERGGGGRGQRRGCKETGLAEGTPVVAAPPTPPPRRSARGGASGTCS